MKTFASFAVECSERFKRASDNLMKIGLIAMSGVRIRTQDLERLGVTLPGFVRRGKVIASLPSLGLLTVAALTPRHHEVQYLELDGWSSGDTLPDFDLVGISSFTAMIADAYALADELRRTGVRVVLGGLHVSACPDEALEHADAIVTDGAEDAWPQLLADAESRVMKRIYRGLRDDVFSRERLVTPRFDLMSGRPYNRITVQTSRGCPRDCEFCAASLRITRRYQQKPVTAVIEEIRCAVREMDEPFFELADDNTFLDRNWSRDFLRALRGEEIRFFTETDASIADDPALCDLLAEAGCRQLLIGFESPRARDLVGIDPSGWKSRQAPEINRVVETLQSRGVSVNGCFVLGLDHQDTDVFPAVREAARASGMAEVQYTVQTPFPGTPLHRRLSAEGRLLAGSLWPRCTLFDVAFQPLRMSVAELEEGMRWLFRESYSEPATRSRVAAFARQRRSERTTTSKPEAERR